MQKLNIFFSKCSEPRNIGHCQIWFFARLEKLTNGSRSISTVNEQLFSVELTKIASWTSMSEYMLHSNFRQTLTRVVGGNFGAYTFILPLSLFPKYLSMFLDVLSTERILNKIKILRNFRNTQVYFATAKSSCFDVRVIKNKKPTTKN